MMGMWELTQMRRTMKSFLYNWRLLSLLFGLGLTTNLFFLVCITPGGNN